MVLDVTEISEIYKCCQPLLLTCLPIYRALGVVLLGLALRAIAKKEKYLVLETTPEFLLPLGIISLLLLMMSTTDSVVDRVDGTSSHPVSLLHNKKNTEGP
jgi:hypothetical protein